jgi:tetratricopeptide (TPR) repeat protein
MARTAEDAGPLILGPEGYATIRRLDMEQHNVRAAIDWALATGDTTTGIRVAAPIWRWFQQRGRLREAREVLERLMAERPSDDRLQVAGLTALGGLAYWSDDFDAARTAYEQRLALAERTGDPSLVAEGHYDLGFIFMVSQDPDRLREHEQAALDLYLRAGDADGALRARQALVLGVFLLGDNKRALELEAENLAAFRAANSEHQIGDSMTFHAGVYFRSGDPGAAWEFVADGLRLFAKHENQSGLARGLGMAAIILLTYGDAELGARVAGATYRIVREKGVMLAPVRVLHLRDPAEIAVERLGGQRANELMDAGADEPLAQIIEEVLAAPAPKTEPNNVVPIPGAAGH